MTLGAYSSRIVCSVGCAALTLLLAATTRPTFGAPTASAVESLSAAQLSRLPDAALIKLKTGRTVSLGILRTEHKLRLQRFADAAKLGKQRALLQKHMGLASNTQAKLALGTIQPQPTLVPMDFSLNHFSQPPQQGACPGCFSGGQAPLPADYLAFCKAAHATACLYLPSGLNCGSAAPWVYCYDDDPLITDSPLCGSEGGVLAPSWGCYYFYPLQYSLNFNPGPPTAQGVYNVTQSANCPSPFVVTVDPHGAVSLTTSSMAFTSPTPSCVVSVFVMK